LFPPILVPREADVCLSPSALIGYAKSQCHSGLDAVAWGQRREQLKKLGGPPNWGPRWSIDPVLAGTKPTARADEWVKREHWSEAKKAFDEAARQLPYNADILVERGRILLNRGMTTEADDDFIEAFGLGNRDEELLDRLIDNESLFLRACAKDSCTALRLADVRAQLQAIHRNWSGAAATLRVAMAYSPDDPKWHHRLILTLLAAGDQEAALRARAEMLHRFGAAPDPDEAIEIAWAASVVPGAIDRPELSISIRLAERAAESATASQKDLYNNTLGAALYRAGRLEATIDRLKQGVGEADSAFLAMAHHRLGHRAEARLWLNTMRNRKPNPDRNAVWGELEISLLQSEAEALILYDPIFPADPFAH
jgi:tetratricopeptide (TPR) repeat protein